MTDPWRERFDGERRDAANGVVPDPAPWVRELSVAASMALASAVKEAAASIPTPLDERAYQPEHRYLERVAGWCDWLQGRGSTRLEAAERVVWLRGGNPLPYLRVLAEVGELMHALRLAQEFVERAGEDEDEAVEVREFMQAVDVVPVGFDEAIIAALPDPEAVERVLENVEPTHLLRLHWRIAHLARDAGLTGDALFAVITLRGASPLALEMVDEGKVSARVVEVTAARFAGSLAEGLWYGLAARAACVAGDHFGTVRLLKIAFAKADPGLPPEMDQAYVWERAGDDLRAILIRQGLAPPEEMR